jgi:hypothetical protein
VNIELTYTEAQHVRDSVARNYNRVLRRGRKGTDRASEVAMTLATLQGTIDKLDAQIAAHDGGTR